MFLFHENGRIAVRATLRFWIAHVVPFWDGDAPGRPYTRKEMRVISSKALHQQGKIQ